MRLGLGRPGAQKRSAAEAFGPGCTRAEPAAVRQRLSAEAKENRPPPAEEGDAGGDGRGEARRAALSSPAGKDTLPSGPLRPSFLVPKHLNKPFRPPVAKGSAAAAAYRSASGGPLPTLGVKRGRKTAALYDHEAEGALVLYEPPANAKLAMSELAREVHVVVDPGLSRLLRPHQQEGVRFMYESLSGHKNAPGGCILAHEMGLGKTLQTITVLWTLFEQSPSGLPTISNALILCPSSLVRNWAAEIVKWLGAHRLTAYQVLSSSREQTLKVIEGFQRAGAYGKPVLIMSYESFRAHVEVVTKGKVDLLICDEGHRLKNGQSGISGAVSQLRTPRKLLLTGTPVQNNLDEFFALISLVRPGMLGTSAEFKKAFARHILRGRDTDCSEEELARSRESSRKLMELIRPIFLRRSNRMLARYLPPKVEQIVFVTLSPLQRELSRKFLSSKLVRNAQAGNRKGALESLTVLTKLCNHPSLIFLESLESDVAAKKEMAAAAAEQRRAEEAASAPSPPGVSNARQLMNCEAAVAGVGAAASASPSSSVAAPKLRPHLQGMADVFPPNFRPRMLDPAWSGKLNFVCKLLHTVKTTTQDRVVLVSNYTRTLDLIEQVFRLQRVTLLRLDGSVSTKQRQDIVDLFNSPRRLYDCILLSSKASGCGLNLVGANRLVMFDPDWNPATDQQAMARVWRDGQKRPVFIYRLFSTGTIEEKMFQRQLFKLSVADSVAEDRGAADQTDPAEDESGGDPEPVDCDGEVDAAAEETAEDLDDEELNDLFSYNESTVCETQEKIKGAFTQWKRFRGVQLVEDLCLKVMLSVLACVARLAISSAHAEREPSQRAGADLVTFVMCKYFNRAGLRDALIAEQRRPAPPRSA